jgi:hypothetical protein
MKTRFFWLVCILAMHAAIGLTMGMYLFALVMIVLNLAAFGVGITVPWHRAGDTRQFRAVSSEAAILPVMHPGRCGLPRLPARENFQSSPNEGP